MAFLRPCARCPHKVASDGAPCPIRQEKADIIRRAKLTLANFRCDKRLSDLPPGQRVRLTMKSCDQPEDGDESYYPTFEEEEFQGTVMRPHKTRVLIWLDELSPLGRNPVALRPDRIFPITGERVNLCPDCGQPEGTQGRKEFSCSNDWCMNRAGAGVC